MQGHGVPALKWIDISDENYGFSLLNNCKYGHKVKGNAMEITLIRSGWEPDSKSDVGAHDFIYSILPHKGGWRESETIKQGYCLNNPVIASLIQSSRDGSWEANQTANQNIALPETQSYVQINNSNVVISAFKKAESGEALILRLYEGAGVESNVRLDLGFDVISVEEVDLNEHKTFGDVGSRGRSFKFSMGKFEIKTLKLVL